MIKYAHSLSLQEDADAQWHDPTMWLPADYTAFCNGTAHAYQLPDDQSSPPSTPDIVDTVTKENSLFYGDENEPHTRVAPPVIQNKKEPFFMLLPD